MCQAILTKYHCPTNHKGSRYSAACDAGRIVVSAAHELNPEENHKRACLLLRQRIAERNAARYGRPASSEPWLRPMVCGQLPTGDYAHVFTEE